MLMRSLLLGFAVLALAADDPTVVRSRILFGSCVHQERPQPIWDAILDAKPDLFIMGGDNIYGDTKDMDIMRAKYQKLGAQPGYQKLLKQCPILATWDDHDFGADDAGATYVKREDSQQVFLDFFGFAKDDPLRTQKGIHHARTFGPPEKLVQVIMLDTRYHRSPLKKKAKFISSEGAYEPNLDKKSTVLGEEQWKWLGEELRKPAKLRIIVSSIQVVSQEHGFEKWMNFPHERERLFKLLQDTKAQGVIILSGDRHLADLSVMDPGLSYPLFDLTSSGLNQGAKKWRFPELNQHRVAGMQHGNNFAAVLVDWSPPDPVIRLQLRDEAGEVTVQEKFTLGLLQPGLMKSKAAVGTLARVDGQPLDAERLKALLDKEVTLEMKVSSTGGAKGGAMIYLNSSEDFKNASNFTVALNKSVQDEMKSKGIDNPRTHFEGKNIRLVGPLTLYQNRPQIIVPDASKITLVED